MSGAGRGFDAGSLDQEVTDGWFASLPQGPPRPPAPTRWSTDPDTIRACLDGLRRQRIAQVAQVVAEHDDPIHRDSDDCLCEQCDDHLEDREEESTRAYS